MPIEQHPTPFELEAHHVGEGSPGLAQHLHRCPPCAGYVRGLEDEAATFRARAQPERFVRALRTRSRGGGTAARHWTFSLSLPLAGALGVALCFAASRPASVVPSGRADADELRPRGGQGAPAVEVILWHARDGHQSRHAAEVEARPGDRFRVEVAVPEATVLEAVIVEDGGARMSLGARRVFAAGSHLLEPTFTFDDRPLAARLLVGPPDAIARALAGPPDGRVRSVRVRVGGPAPVPGSGGP
jgi:hypothetical protein